LGERDDVAGVTASKNLEGSEIEVAAAAVVVAQGVIGSGTLKSVSFFSAFWAMILRFGEKDEKLEEKEEERKREIIEIGNERERKRKDL